jgi:hypothetical protein
MNLGVKPLASDHAVTNAETPTPKNNVPKPTSTKISPHSAGVALPNYQNNRVIQGYTHWLGHIIQVPSGSRHLSAELATRQAVWAAIAADNGHVGFYRAAIGVDC